MADLHMNLNGEYFDAIKSGNKHFEYRLKNLYWEKKLAGREYDLIHFKSGYPKRDDRERIHSVPYRGYRVCTIVHPHFGSDAVEVFAIYTDDSMVGQQ